jgi:hypothetical protein
MCGHPRRRAVGVCRVRGIPARTPGAGRPGRCVAGDDALSLRGQELAPGRAAAARGRIDAGRRKDLPNCRGADGMSEANKFALDPTAAPARVSRASRSTSAFTALAGRRSAGPAPALAVVPLVCDESAVPSEQGRGRYREHLRPSVSGYPRGQRREPQSVRRLVPNRSREVSAQHRVLMPQREQFGILGRVPGAAAPPGPRAASVPPGTPVRRSPGQGSSRPSWHATPRSGQQR